MDNILVFGGSGGIGSEISKKFASKKSNNVIIIDLIENERLKSKPNIFFEKCDVTNYHSLVSLKDRILNKYGKISHIVSLAGRAILSEFDGLIKMDYSDILRSVELNLISHIFIAKVFGECFTQTKNQTISLISSINSFTSYGLPAYSAAKAGLIGLMNAILNEFGKMKIRVNTFSLGTVVTSATLTEPKDFEVYLNDTKISRFTSKSEVAKTVYSVVYEMTSMTGQNIVLDAGQSVK